MPLYRALSIAGFDGSGGAGIQADLKTFSALGCYGMTTLTALPVQNTTGVKSIYPISEICVAEQLEAILEDIGVDAIKIGMLHRKEIVEVVSNTLKKYPSIPIVLDPVMSATSDHKLITHEAIAAIKALLFPMISILTPNLSEASLLVQKEVKTRHDMEMAALELIPLGPQAVLIKGGHLDHHFSDDLLCMEDKKMYWFSFPKIQSVNTHGTGCTLSAAIAAFLSQGINIYDACYQAKIYLSQCIMASSTLKIGHGHGPVHHFFSYWDM